MTLRTEIATDPLCPPVQKAVSRAGIQSGLLLLKHARSYWESVESSLGLLEWVVRRNNLGPVDDVSCGAMEAPPGYGRQAGEAESTASNQEYFMVSDPWQISDLGNFFHIPLDLNWADHLPDLELDLKSIQ